uniref:hypothetical protein n=1 Tax=uncultured Nostoc sp. TaxID=340711 RepID=UPI0035CB8D8A
MDTPILDRLIEELKVMPEDLQYRVLEFVQTLVGSQIHGVPGRQLVTYLHFLSTGKCRLLKDS